MAQADECIEVSLLGHRTPTWGTEAAGDVAGRGGRTDREIRKDVEDCPAQQGRPAALRALAWSLHQQNFMKTLSLVSLFVGLALFVSAGVASATVEEKSFWDRFHVSADGRLRYEYDGGRIGGADTRHRGRARFRFGGTVDVTDEIRGGLRIRTGNSDNPNSPHQNFGSMFDSWEIALDRAFLTYEPEWAKGAWIQGGKFPNAFKTNPVYGELVWDADVNPEGGQLGYGWSQNGFSVGGSTGIWVLNLSGSETATIFPVQGHAEFKFNDDLKAAVAFGYYGYYNMDHGGAETASSFPQNSNATYPAAFGPTAGEFISRFRVIDTFASVTYAGLPVSLTLVGEVIYNAGARNGRDAGWAVGVNALVPLCERKHRVFYQFQYIEQEALFSPMGQDDFQSLASNYRGHIVGVDWAITKGVKIRTWGLFQEQMLGGGDRLNARVRADINVKF